MRSFLTALFLLAAAIPVFSQSYLNFPIDTIVSDQYYNYRSMIKYDANGKIHLVNSRQFDTQSETREIFYRTNASGSFVTTRLTNNSVDDNYATFGFDTQGFTHIGWERRDASNNFQVMYANNRNGTFVDTTWITTGGVNKATPFMAVGKDSLVHFVYYTYATGNNNAYYRSYNYVTHVLGPETLLGPGQTGSENDIEVAVDNNNKIHIIFCTNVNLNGGALKYFTNESGTLTEVATGITANGEYPDIHIANDNTVYVLYRLATDHRLYILKRTAGTGGAFAAPFAISPGGIGNPAYWRAIDTDDNGRLYVTYMNSVSSAPKGFFLIHGTGTNFSQPILVFEDSTGTYIGRGSSSVAAKGNGEVAIAFDPTVVRNGSVASDIMIKKGTLTLTSIEPVSEAPAEFNLSQNYPNPFNPTTSISYSLKSANSVSLKVYDVKGNLMKILVNERKAPGEYSVTFDGAGFASGVYFYKLETEGFKETRRMLLIK